MFIMAPDRILDLVAERVYGGTPRWQAWRDLQDELGYRKVYHAYLRSEEWQEFRDRVLKIRPTCECCLVSEASEVHHLDYRYLFFENGAMVQCVCRKCHQTMTGMDNDRRRRDFT